MPIVVPSGAVLTLLRDLVAKASAGLMLQATRIAAAGQLVEAGYAIATDIDRGIELRASQTTISLPDLSTSEIQSFAIAGGALYASG
jgi:hypothetical protein